MTTYVEAEGMIHLENPTNGEFTLCGDAFDLESDVPGYKRKRTRLRTVTCPHCAKIIQDCRHVRTKVPA